MIKIILLNIILSSMVTYDISDAEIKQVQKDFEKVMDIVGEVKPRDFMKAAKPYVVAVRSAAPVADQDVKRYNTAKLNSKKRAPKGMGKVVATYTPGNLGRSFKRIPLRRLKRSVVIGPKLAKGSKAHGVFQGARTDGYYAHIVEAKGPHRSFQETTWCRMRGVVRSNVIRMYKDKIVKANKMRK